MSEVYDRYIKQFSVMESAVTEMNSIRERIQQTSNTNPTVNN